jgi:mono-ADP-ribosyltransferase sirtuin 6
MGSSLTVTPAADVPKTVGKKGSLVIVNLQKTPIDKYAKIKINALCDEVMTKLMKVLEI